MNSEALSNALLAHFNDEAGLDLCKDTHYSFNTNGVVKMEYLGDNYRDFVRAALSASDLLEKHDAVSSIMGYSNEYWFLNVFNYDVNEYNDISETACDIEHEGDKPYMFYAKLRKNIYRRGVRIRPSVLRKYQGMVSGEGLGLFVPEDNPVYYSNGGSSFIEPFERILPEWGFSEVNLMVKVIDEDDSMRIRLAI